MKHALIALALLTLASTPSSAADGGEAASIQEVIDRAYVQGIHNDRDGEKIRSGFHESFIMFVRTDDGLRQITRDGWIERIESSKSRGDQEPQPKATGEITVLDVTGNAAVAKVEIFRSGQHVFTDYMSLYKFDDGWKLVGKIYQSHK